MKVFLDTNVILDVIEGRQGFVIPASNIIQLGIDGALKLYATPLTFANCMYVARKNVGIEAAREGLKVLKKLILASMMDDAQCTNALLSDMPDFEDALQCESALAAKCEAIVTRDKRHFLHTSIPVFSPESFLQFLCEQNIRITNWVK